MSLRIKINTLNNWCVSSKCLQRQWQIAFITDKNDIVKIMYNHFTSFMLQIARYS
jgi:hypothetical protein